MSEFRRRKLRTFFTLFDVKKAGVMSKDDWMQMAVRFAKYEKEDKQKAERLKTLFGNGWEQFFKYSEKKKQHTRDEFVEAILNQRYGAELIKSEAAVIRGFFDMMDVNCDGYLDEGEYERIFSQFSAADAPYAKEMFKAIDTNGDGKLSFEEFIHAYYDFLFSEDEKSPVIQFFGPLVD